MPQGFNLNLVVQPCLECKQGTCFWVSIRGPLRALQWRPTCCSGPGVTSENSLWNTRRLRRYSQTALKNPLIAWTCNRFHWEHWWATCNCTCVKTVEFTMNLSRGNCGQIWRRWSSFQMA